MIRELTCIECPKGCRLIVDVENNTVIRVTGNQCPKGEAYAKEEVTCPRRIITSTVAARGLALPMIPVRTTCAVPKQDVIRIMEYLRTVVVEHPVTTGECIAANLLGLGIDLVATRTVQ